MTAPYIREAFSGDAAVSKTAERGSIPCTGAHPFAAVLSMTAPLIDREVASHDYSDALRRADTRGQAEAAKRVKAATCRIMGANT